MPRNPNRVLRLVAEAFRSALGMIWRSVSPLNASSRLRQRLLRRHRLSRRPRPPRRGLAGLLAEPVVAEAVVLDAADASALAVPVRVAPVVVEEAEALVVVPVDAAALWPVVPHPRP
jgi:hypothetical protein